MGEDGSVLSANLPLQWYEEKEKQREFKAVIGNLLSRSGFRKKGYSPSLKVLFFPEVIQKIPDINEHQKPTKEDIERIAYEYFARYFPEGGETPPRIAYDFAIEGLYVSAIPSSLFAMLSESLPLSFEAYSGALVVAKTFLSQIPPGVRRAFLFYVDGGTALGFYFVSGNLYSLLRLSPLEKITPEERTPDVAKREYVEALAQDLEGLLTRAEEVRFFVAGGWGEHALRELGFSLPYARHTHGGVLEEGGPRGRLFPSALTQRKRSSSRHLSATALSTGRLGCSSWEGWGPTPSSPRKSRGSGKNSPSCARGKPRRLPSRGSWPP